jgi:ABC-type branched-subunit amino acid transport system permease subunit
MVRSIVGYGIIAFGALYALFYIPQHADLTTMINGSVYASYGVLALSLALIWGFAGILSFGQAAFFGIGGYAYAVAALNFDNTTMAACIAVIAAAFSAALLGYFMFWGRISDVYLGVITLTVSLILSRFFNQTAGDQWVIGTAPLGGFNGIPSTPIITLPGDPSNPLPPEKIYVLTIATLTICYLICKVMLATRFGAVIVAIRENETRAELLGYDARFYKLGVFTIGGAMAGAAGVLFANCVFVSPNMFNLQTNGQLIIWIIIGGVGTLVGPVVGCFLALMLSSYLGTLGHAGILAWLDPNLVMGVVLTVFVLVMRKGLLPLLISSFDRAAWLIARRPEKPLTGSAAADLSQ